MDQSDDTSLTFTHTGISQRLRNLVVSKNHAARKTIVDTWTLIRVSDARS